MEKNSLTYKTRNESVYSYDSNNFWRFKKGSNTAFPLNHATYISLENYKLLIKRLNEQLEHKKITKHDLIELIDEFKDPNFKKIGGIIVSVTKKRNIYGIWKSSTITDITTNQKKINPDSDIVLEDDDFP